MKEDIGVSSHQSHRSEHLLLGFVSPLFVFLSVFVCRSSSPSCSSVGGFHQSKRLRHGQLVSAPLPPSLQAITPNIDNHVLTGLGWRCSTCYRSKHAKVFPPLLGIVFHLHFLPSVFSGFSFFIQFYDSQELVSDSFSKQLGYKQLYI